MSAADQELSGRVAIVTGAGAGIGAGLAAALAGAGAAVAVADIDEAGAAATVRGIEETGGRALAVRVDVSDAGPVEDMVRRTAAAFGGVDVLVNNAGIATTELVEDLDEARWRRVLDVNLTGAFLCSKAVLPLMRAKGWGRIVNIASVAAKRISFTGAASYTASKAGLLGFTRHLAYEVAPYGINVNAICPGPTLTPMYERNADEQTRRERIAMVPKGRWITPGDLGRVTVFLCSEAADPLCGLALDVDGGSLLGWMPWETYMTKRRRR
ncbi:MAG: SDR family oxidoreductase [Candidatus Rokubacteria bacterium]|nr:SDR family oxidoreductase [Candidatus Rokubacteria bacterium]